jgi:hypothetical protein
MKQLYANYVSYVRGNVETVRLLESLLQTVVFFMPSRFVERGGAEVWSEAGYAASNLLALLHEHIIKGRPPDEALPPEAGASLSQAIASRWVCCP